MTVRSRQRPPSGTGPPRRLIAALIVVALACTAVAALWWNSDRTTASPPPLLAVSVPPPAPVPEKPVGGLVLDRDTAPVGARLTVWLSNWQPGNVLVRLCGNAGARGSVDCANGSAVTGYVGGPTPTAVVLAVDAPPVACPCVVQASDPTSASRASRAFIPTGLPALPQAPASDASTPSALQVVDARLTDERPWRERWSAWFGGSVHRTLVLTLRNAGPGPVGSPPLSVTVGRDDPPTTLVTTPDIGTLAPGEQRTFHIEVTLGAPAYGTYRVHGQLSGMAADQGGDVVFTLRTSTTPWALVAAAVLLFAWLVSPFLAPPLRRLLGRRTATAGERV